MAIEIHETTDADLAETLLVVQAAFGEEEGLAIAGLVSDLLSDPSAAPVLSLLAVDTESDEPTGHILFTRASIAGADETAVLRATILAPLAVIPAYQNRGIGGRLIGAGIERLREDSTDLVFVLGYPDYYTRFDFIPAGAQGFDAPYPIPAKNADAWMVQELRPGILETTAGTVVCANALDREEYWRE